MARPDSDLMTGLPWYGMLIIFSRRGHVTISVNSFRNITSERAKVTLVVKLYETDTIGSSCYVSVFIWGR